MHAQRCCFLAIASFLLAASGALHAQTQMTTAFTYQSYLTESQLPADGVYNHPTYKGGKS